MLQYISFLLSLISFLIISSNIFRDVKKNKQYVLLNPFFWAGIYLIFYFILPSFFVFKIDFYFNWKLEESSILYSSILIFIFSISIAVPYIFCTSSFRLSNESENQEGGIITFVIWLLISFYLIYVFYVTIKNYDFMHIFNYSGEVGDTFKLKNLAYLMISVSVFMFWKFKRIVIFLPAIFIVSLDLLNGSRTIAFISLVPIFISICIYKKSLFIIPGIIILSLLLFLGIIRSDNVVNGVPWYLSAIGEFRETYITLPLFIADNNYVGSASIFHLLGAISVGLLYFFRGDIIEQYQFAGHSMYLMIDRGYGLGSNLLIESVYYGYFCLIVTILIFPLFLYLFKRFIEQSSLPVAIINTSIMIIFLRLIFREGLYPSIGTLLLVLLVYFFPIYILNKFSWKNK
ncbi:hypothetical protein HNW13_008565 [Shewanella sp. BF02_Schw]|uniref:hypothetical protein n=1 Tax=Shewanella sp. BF02_Schw TaxID=394908 RepID=UPI001783708C|nr:hypothetical protein [Shewanella sp. BF02_Schw]MBO1895824.1 hypothetical protein [Shewanella sp. BF02_Schw]